MKKQETAKIESIPEIKIQEVQVSIIGDTSLICHAWSEKAKAMIRDKQAKKAKVGREARNPEQEFKDSLYPHPDGGYGFPSVAFKAAAVDAAQSANMTKADARRFFHINGDLVQIQGEPIMREDMVRVGMGAADLRYRGEFKGWKAVLTVRYNSAMISAEQIKTLFNIAGFSCGIGEWRPQKDGSYGMFHVE